MEEKFNILQVVKFTSIECLKVVIRCTVKDKSLHTHPGYRHSNFTHFMLRWYIIIIFKLLSESQISVFCSLPQASHNPWPECLPIPPDGTSVFLSNTFVLL